MFIRVEKARNKQKKAKSGSIRHKSDGTSTDEEALKMEARVIKRRLIRNQEHRGAVFAFHLFLWVFLHGHIVTWASCPLCHGAGRVLVFICKKALAWRLCVPLGHIGRGRRKNGSKST